MTRRDIIVRTESHFDDIGKWGIGLLFFSPLVQAWAYWQLLSELAEQYRQPALGLPITFLIAGGIGLIAAILMILIGRFQISTIRRL
jgi:CHASE1-domain containing sensor protein